ncbi:MULTISPECIES: CBU_0592 family membrane protein [unclassified Schaalia]|uniref:CBU_0592 family membrane protein n=1 Tax=unclassified Schaalia TaxID=2691889 RepID=UPI001E339CA4|nr:MULTISPECIES: hypothetical protein [unclassified Schaalia]MCD4550279.1 hypothetical protein [Schaalia sp. lx-260]MCD4558103.1 hypothetical protein [Schaalia sp. lx-100]
MTISVTHVALLLGWIGAAGSMCAYYLVSTGRVAPDSLRYHALNVSACLLLAVTCLATGSWPSMVTNLLFVLIGLRMTWRVRDRLAARLRHIATCVVRPLKAKSHMKTTEAQTLHMQP